MPDDAVGCEDKAMDPWPDAAGDTCSVELARPVEPWRGEYSDADSRCDRNSSASGDMGSASLSCVSSSPVVTAG